MQSCISTQVSIPSSLLIYKAEVHQDLYQNSLLTMSWVPKLLVEFKNKAKNQTRTTKIIVLPQREEQGGFRG